MTAKSNADSRLSLAADYRPLREMPIRAGGREAIAEFQMVMSNMHEGGLISDHDVRVGNEVAYALCGGDVDAGTTLDEERYLHCEREGFRRLVGSPETQARIQYTLDTGKPLRN